MELNPSQLLKLRWLASQTRKMKPADATYVREIVDILSKGDSFKHVHPITTLMIDQFYSHYTTLLKGKLDG